MGRKPKKKFDTEAVQERFNEARSACNAMWEDKTRIKRGGHFCFGPIDGHCGVCHESKAHAINCLMRFRVNKGGRFSDREIYRGQDAERPDISVFIPGYFSERGAFNGEQRDQVRA